MNTFGRLLRVAVFGESHGPAVGVVVDGCPAGLRLSAADFEPALARRRGGQAGTTARVEPDRPLIESGVFEGHTTGAPLIIRFENHAQRSDDYTALRHTPRPGHADLAWHHKFGGYNDPRGGGHASGRLTVGLVAAGVVAQKVLAPATVAARVVELGGRATGGEGADDVAAAPTPAQQALLAHAAAAGDTLGGVVECVAEGLPAGLGEPFWDSVEALLAHAVFSIPGVKAVEFGAGMAAARMRGSVLNDPILPETAKGHPVRTADLADRATNHAGGIQGGVTSGMPIVLRVAVRPAASVAVAQSTVDLRTGAATTVRVGGRHDTCIALRVPPVLEAVTAIVLADLLLCQRAYAPK